MRKKLMGMSRLQLRRLGVRLPPQAHRRIDLIAEHDRRKKFQLMCLAARIAAPSCEHRFHPTRRWRIDFAWPAAKVGLEVDGGVWAAGRHTRGSGWTNDTEKLNAAVASGWRMLRCTPQQLWTQQMIATIRDALAAAESTSNVDGSEL